MAIEKITEFKGDAVITAINSIIDVVNDIKTYIDSKEVGFDVDRTRIVCKNIIQSLNNNALNTMATLHNSSVPNTITQNIQKNLVYYTIRSVINYTEKNKTNKPYYFIDAKGTVIMSLDYVAGVGAFTFYSIHGAKLFLELFPKSELIEFIALRGTNK